MQNVIIIKDGRDIKKVYNIRGYLEMRIRKHFDKLNCQFVRDNQRTVIFNVKTTKRTFESIKEKLDALYPGLCVYLQKK